MKKITWLDMNSSYSHSSAALPFIEAQSVNHSIKYEWGAVKATIKSDIRQIVWELVKQNPDVIAYTSWLFTCDIVNQILSRVKRVLPDVLIIGGGPEYLGDNEKFLREHSYVDYVVRGEGECSFYGLMEYMFSNKNNTCKIKGVCYLSNEIYVDNSIAKVMDFAELRLPETSRFFDWSKPFVQLETTRGCFNSCAFCVSGNDKPLRNQSMELVEKRIKTIFEKGIKDVRMLDRTFNSNTKRAIAMLKLFAQYQDMTFYLELHPALLNKEVMDAIALLPKGILHIEAGIQSLDDKVLKACGRAGEKQKALEGLTYLCGLNNVDTHADLIAGLPYYTLEQLYCDVIELAKINAGEIQLESLKLLPGTEMREKAMELGLKYSPLSPYEVLKSSHISILELHEAMVLSRVLDFYYNSVSWNYFFKNMLCKESEFLQKIIAYFIEKDCYNQPLSQEKQGMIMHEFLSDKYSKYLVDFKIEWIKNGLSLRKKPTQGVHSLTITSEGTLKTIFGVWNKDMRFYHFTENGIEYIFGFNRGIEHSKPIYCATRTATI